MAKGDASQAVVAKTPEERVAVPPCILIVDDDAISRTALAELLCLPGCVTVTAESGEEALRQVPRQDFAAIILDVHMPRLNGFETAKLIRECERSRHTPIIFLTASCGDAQPVFRGYEAGAVDYLVKPPDANALRSKVAVFVDLHERNAQLSREVAERRQIEAQLRASEENLRALALHLQSVREEERARISREIHDELGQELTGLKIELKSIARTLPKTNRTLREKTESALALTDQTIQSVRRIASGLRPAVTDQLGLADAVEWQVKEFRRRTGTRCKVMLPAVMPPLDQEQATAMFRICQELLTNVARHSGATRAEVAIHADERTLTLSIEDNGKGLGDADLYGPQALGFIGMRERIRQFGGRIDVDAAPTRGTKVSAMLPLDGRREAS